MKKAVLLLVLGALLVGSSPVLADGRFYWPEPVPPEIPYQRALLLFDGNREMLILQSRYRMSGPVTSEFGWVVPVPSVPELASIEPRLADSLFLELARQSQLKVTRISGGLWGFLAIICVVVAPVIAVLLFLMWLASFFTPRLQFVRRRRWMFAVASVFLFLFGLCGLAFFIVYIPVARAPASTVEVIREEQVGIYDVQVVRAGDAGDLILWLNQRQFQYDEQDTQVFDQYLRRGWCFVVARVDPIRSADDKGIIAEGLVAPLILHFETDAPVYPLALTATAGHDTQVLLYVLGKNKWQTDGRLELEYAGETHLGGLEELCRQAVPDMPVDCLAYGALPYLCKFKGTLTPAQMEEDLVLTPAEDDEPYRKHVVIW